MAGGSFGGGTGTALDPYLIEDDLDLNAIRNQVTSDLYYRQTQDIDTSVNYPSSWTPLVSGAVANNFTAFYDGGNFTISNLKNTLFNTIPLPTSDNSIRVKNLVVNVNINVNLSNVGGLCKNATGAGGNNSDRLIAKNVHVTGSITNAGFFTAGFIAYCTASGSRALYATAPILKYCSCSASINAGAYVGGIIGFSFPPSTGRVNIEDCKVDGAIQAASYVGGIIGITGQGDTTAERCIVSGNISGVSYIGGIIGVGGGNSPSTYSLTEAKKCVALMDTITRTSGAAATFGRIFGGMFYTGSNIFNLEDNRALDTMSFVG